MHRIASSFITVNSLHTNAKQQKKWLVWKKKAFPEEDNLLIKCIGNAASNLWQQSKPKLLLLVVTSWWNRLVETWSQNLLVNGYGCIHTYMYVWLYTYMYIYRQSLWFLWVSSTYILLVTLLIDYRHTGVEDIYCKLPVIPFKKA